MIKRGMILFIVFLLTLSLATALDIYEPDDNFGNATYLEINSDWQFHDFNSTEFNVTEDNDYVKFNATAGKEYVIETQALESYDEADTYIYLYYENGTLIDTNDDIQNGLIRDSRLTLTATNDMTYYVWIKEYYSQQGGKYNIRVHEPFGILVPYIVYPTENLNVSQYTVFNVTLGFQCIGGICMDVDVYLDPKENKDNKVEKRIFETLENANEVSVIVKFKDDVSQLQDFDLEHELETVNMVTGIVNEQGLENLQKSDKVEKVFYNRPISLFLDQSIPFINADDVWTRQLNGLNITGEGYSVCVLDTGINYQHEAFGSCNQTNNISDGSCEKVIAGYDFVNNDADPMADHEHGTHVAGIVASENTTYPGVAPGAKIVAIKVLDSSGNGNLANLLAGMDWCISKADVYNISVLSLSLGDNTQLFTEPCNLMPEAETINRAVENGILVTIASGNEGQSDRISVPGCVENATTVGSVTLSDGFSSFGNRANFLDILAPGNSIFAPYGTSYTSLSGTSMATPHVAGAAVLVKQWFKQKYDRDLTAYDLNKLLKYPGKTLTENSIDYKRLDVLSAIDAKGLVPTEYAEPFYTLSSNPAIDSCLMFIAENETCNQTWIVNATGEEGTWQFFGIYGMENDWYESPKFNVTIYVPVPPPNIEPNFTQNISDIEFVEDNPYLLNLTDNFYDTEELTYSLFNITNLTLTQNGTIANLTSDLNFNGIKEIQITATDSINQSVISNIFIVNITAVNDAPVLSEIANVSIIITESVQINAEATDVDSINLTFTYESPLNASGFWQTTDSDAGNYTLNVTVYDGELTDSRFVTIFVSSNITTEEEPEESNVVTSDEEEEEEVSGGGGGYVPTSNDDEEEEEDEPVPSIIKESEEDLNTTIGLENEIGSTPTGFFSTNIPRFGTFLNKNNLHYILAFLIVLAGVAMSIVFNEKHKKQ
ncbi:MAG: S8 family serine peptidase [archaeon]